MRSPLELTFGALWGALGPLLGGSWPSLGRSWALLGPSWGALGRSWGALDARKNRKKINKLHFLALLVLLGCSWPCLGPSGPHFHTSQPLFWSISGLPGGKFGYLVHRVFQRSSFQSFQEHLLGIWLGSA